MEPVVAFLTVRISAQRLGAQGGKKRDSVELY
jgi:hypothetical protein